MNTPHHAGHGWRVLPEPGFGLAHTISSCIAASDYRLKHCLHLLRDAPTLLMFSDYGGAHKQARYEVLSFLVSSHHGIQAFNVRQNELRGGPLGKRRMSFKALNDNVRMRYLRNYLDTTDQISGLLINFALDKHALERLSEGYKSDTAIGHLGPWSSRSFEKLTRIGHLAAILIEGIRTDGQNLIWITDEDEIAPNRAQHAEATKILSHYLNAYCSGPMGNFRFGTTASDTGDLLIEDLAAVTDVAAGCLGEAVPWLAPNPRSGLAKSLLLPTDGSISLKSVIIAYWLARSPERLTKLNLVLDECGKECSIRNLRIVIAPGIFPIG